MSLVKSEQLDSKKLQELSGLVEQYERRKPQDGHKRELPLASLKTLSLEM